MIYVMPGNDLAAASGATLRELMVRMGLSTARAALVYLHYSDERQRKIAESLDALLREQLTRGGTADERSGSSESGTNLHKPESRTRWLTACLPVSDL
jgi:hypothetical protein